jgi:hypothetical protein
MALTIPQMPKGRPSKSITQKYSADMKEFADQIKEIQQQITIKMSSRGWCYSLEGMNVINKGQFDSCEKAINDCRKRGLLPLDFVAADDTRQFHHVEDIHVETEEPLTYLKNWLHYLRDIDEKKNDIAYWENQEYYIEMLVEKKDLLTLFSPTCRKYHVGIANAKGWSDLLVRGKPAFRFKEAIKRNLKPVLLYFGDFDYGGLKIADTIRKNIADLFNATGYDPKDLIIDHFGLSYDFIQAHNLVWIDNLISGSGKLPNKKLRHVADYIATYGERKCEANAILRIPDISLQLLETTIQKYLKNPFDVYDKAVKETQEDVKVLMDGLKIKETINDWMKCLDEMPRHDKRDRESITRYFADLGKSDHDSINLEGKRNPKDQPRKVEVQPGLQEDISEPTMRPLLLKHGPLTKEELEKLKRYMEKAKREQEFNPSLP